MSHDGLYVHVPFCVSRCPYCAFVSYVGAESLHERYVVALCCELELRRGFFIGPLSTVYFGGGTPSLLSPEQLQRVLSAARAVFGLAADVEVTLEANPAEADLPRLQAFRAAGFNRLSLGGQAFDDDALRVLGRRHTAAAAAAAFVAARQAGFGNVSLDLMYGIPGVAFGRWCATVEQAISLHPEHLSAYSLTAEEGTEYAVLLRGQRLEPVSEEVDARCYEWAVERLAGAGYAQYEVSNFALPGRRSRHNGNCWRRRPYLGIGVSAHSFAGSRRRWNVADLGEYLDAVETGAAPDGGEEEIDAPTASRERIWLGLRTSRGVLLSADERRRLELEPRFADLLGSGLLTCAAGRLRPTRPGLAVADALGVEIAGLLERRVPGEAEAGVCRLPEPSAMRGSPCCAV